MRISDWSSDVCSSDLVQIAALRKRREQIESAGARPAQCRRYLGETGGLLRLREVLEHVQDIRCLSNQHSALPTAPTDRRTEPSLARRAWSEARAPEIFLAKPLRVPDYSLSSHS